MYLPRFYVRQKITLMVNRFEIYAADPATGEQGQLMAFAEQKRFAFKEQVTFFSDASKTRAVFGFRARQVIDLNAGYDITDEVGAPLGYFKKDFAQSLLQTTFHVEGAGFAGSGKERSLLFALLRRFADLPVPIHFDYVDSAGAPLLSITRKFAVRDQYDVQVADPRVDFRVAAAIAVGMDVLMDR
ncbi:hypothetical protein GCM10007231_14410 [Nocardioides daphniae]|uniref:Uncharacterized protein n=2 Tax=Nocardioides daphniae TaxID=402297 RepID=A0A4P7UK51_9ACTN|nr:hypothetical protein E2C04_05420 [Nocardioides daphniae]GGD16577.1 hypothetical protein GCM10007231_14410 [Nocardioides daphniae]